MSTSKVSKKVAKDLKAKVVVRRLPPTLPEDVFRKTVQGWVNEDTVVWSVYRLGSVNEK
jgi:regulator of nonsense transcripts 3